MSDIEYTCNNCGHEGYNTRAVPDVTELVRYDFVRDYVKTCNGFRKRRTIKECAQGKYVRHSQAAAIIAAKDKEIERLRKKLRQEFQLGLTTLERAEAAEAKLAQMEKQEAVTIYQAMATDDDENPQSKDVWMDVTQGVYDDLKGRDDFRCRIVYTSPAPAEDLKAENESLKQNLAARERQIMFLEERWEELKRLQERINSK